MPRIVFAQGYPSRPVRLIAPFAAGGESDTVARLIGQWLSERLGQQFVIDNRPGGIGKFIARFPRPWSLAALFIGLPCDRDDLAELSCERIKFWILELIEKALAKLAFVRRGLGIPLRGVNGGIAQLLLWDRKRCLATHVTKRYSPGLGQPPSFKPRYGRLMEDRRS